MLPEMWNLQLPERVNLLKALKEALNQRPVAAPFWACLQVCDLEKFAELVEMAKVTPEPIFKLLETSCLSITLNWMELLPYGDFTALRPPEYPIGPSPLAQKHTRERDNTMCLLTKDYSLDVVDIVPASVVERDTENQADEATPEFWQMLGFFFAEDRIKKWKQVISTIKDAEGCRNQICVTSRVKWRWRSGLMAVYPVQLWDDNTLQVNFFWQPRSEHSRFQLVDIL